MVVNKNTYSFNFNDQWAPRSLQGLEDEFFFLVENGSVSDLEVFLQKHKRPCGNLDFDPNCVNFENTNAMSIAVGTGDWKMVQLLLKIMSVPARGVLMEAIHLGDIELVKNLCEQMRADSGWKDCYDSGLPDGESDFPSNITPLMLAAMNGHFEIIGYLIDRGHSIQEPHKPECHCAEECLQNMEHDRDLLHTATFTLNIYRALSNPSYFVYVTGDPIHYAFKIHRRLIVLSKLERSFNHRYQELAENVRDFASHLVSECRNSEEVELVLKQRSTPTSFLEKTSQNDFPRLLMAMDYDQKEFVTQPNVQIFVQEQFYGTFDDWKYFTSFIKFIFPIFRIFTLPIAFFNAVLSPSSSVAQFYAAPLNRMLHFFATHVLFLIILFMESGQEKSRTHSNKIQGVWTPMIYIYICGLFAGVIHQILYLHPKRFFSCGWNVFDVVMLCMFALSMSFGFASTLHGLNQKVKFSERKYWSGFDPELISEGFLMVAKVMAFLKLMFFFQAHPVVGPLQIALGKMIRDCARYSTFAVMVLLAYATAFSKFYSYYSGMRFRDPFSNETSTQENSFIDWISSFKTFFWAIFTQSDPSSADLVLENLNHTDPRIMCCSTNEHIFTEFVGYFGLGTFSLFVVMIIVNMLIATMTETHANVLSDVHRTWLYGRTVIYVYFMNFSVLPPPLNLFPNLYRMKYLRDQTDLEQARTARGRTIERDYKKLAKILVQRYFESIQREKDIAEPQQISDCQVGMRGFNETQCRSL